MSTPVTEEIRRRWGANVRKRRDELRLSQEDLAAAAGMSQTAISRIELGNQGIPLDVGLALAKALDTSYDALFSVDDAITEAAS